MKGHGGIAALRKTIASPICGATNSTSGNWQQALVCLQNKKPTPCEGSESCLLNYFVTEITYGDEGLEQVHRDPEGRLRMAQG